MSAHEGSAWQVASEAAQRGRREPATEAAINAARAEPDHPDAGRQREVDERLAASRQADREVHTDIPSCKSCALSREMIADGKMLVLTGNALEAYRRLHVASAAALQAQRYQEAAGQELRDAFGALCHAMAGGADGQWHQGNRP